MDLPVVAIIGRPNVGKSSLFNSIMGQMISIVEPTAGVTRDRVSGIIEFDGRFIELIDTGGYGIVDSDELSDHINRQIRTAIEKAAVAVFVVDIREGVTELDKTIARLIRKQGMPVVLAANKCDSAKQQPMGGEFGRLGFGLPVCVSAVNNINKTEVLERVVKELDHLPKGEYRREEMKLAIVGKRNAGKSTLINSIAGEERVIVSEVAGTTRDAVDVRFEKNGKVFVAIDTAGVRKKSKLADDIEFYSYTRATKSVKRADVVLMMIDATLDISQVDKKLAKFVSENFKPCILVINKWDLVKGRAGTEDYHEYIDKVLPGLSYAPIAFTTAMDGKNVQSVLDLAAELYKQASLEIPTGRLNKAVEIIGEEQISVPRKKGGQPRIYYATQVAVRPVTILMFVNRPELFEGSVERFIKNRVREMLPVDEVPIRLLFRPRR